MLLIVVILSVFFLLALVTYLIHLFLFSQLSKEEKRQEIGFDNCIINRQKAQKRNKILGVLVVLFAILALGSSYYALFNEGISAAIGVVESKKSKTTETDLSSTAQSSTSQSSSKKTESTKQSTKQTESKTEDSVKLAKEKAEKEAAEAQKKEQEKEEEKKAEEQKQAAEEDEGNGLSVDVDGNFETNIDGLAVVKGKARKGVKKLSVTNSINDEEKQIDVNADGTFSFEYNMTNPMEAVIIFICDVNEVAKIPKEERPQTMISADMEYMMNYQEAQFAEEVSE